MIKLTQLLLEAIDNPKAIIMAGGASVGKSTVLKSIEPIVKGFENLNADKYVEDKESELYGNVAASYSQIIKKDLPNAIKTQRDFIYDTTASNLSTLQPILDELSSNKYETMMIMVYAHPIVSFLRNFQRERRVPAVGVLGTWVNVYNLLDNYKRIFGENFILVTSPSGPDEQKEVSNFEKAYQDNKLPEYFNNLLSSGEYSSSFRKDDSNLSPEELAKKEKQRQNTQKTLEKNIDKISNTYKDIQSKLDPIDIKDLPNIVKNFVK
jgi:hypothetical protein